MKYNKQFNEDNAKSRRLLIATLSAITIRNPFLFFVDLARQPLWVSMWVAILALANIASLLFWSALTAKVILITFMLSALMMMALYSYYGFV